MAVYRRPGDALELVDSWSEFLQISIRLTTETFPQLFCSKTTEILSIPPLFESATPISLDHMRQEFNRNVKSGHWNWTAEESAEKALYTLLMASLPRMVKKIKNPGPGVLIRGLKFSSGMRDFLARICQKDLLGTKEWESDFLLFHPVWGLVVFEVKKTEANDGRIEKQSRKALKQLDHIGTVLQNLASELEENVTVWKVAAFLGPYDESVASSSENGSVLWLSIPSSVKEFENWWNSKFPLTTDDPPRTLKFLQKILSVLITVRATSFGPQRRLELKPEQLKKTQKLAQSKTSIQMQQFYEHFGTYDPVTCFYLNNTQMNILSHPQKRLIIVGPQGSGKSLLLLLKCAELLRKKEKVLLILPNPQIYKFMDDLKSMVDGTLLSQYLVPFTYPGNSFPSLSGIQHILIDEAQMLLGKDFSEVLKRIWASISGTIWIVTQAHLMELADHMYYGMYDVAVRKIPLQGKYLDQKQLEIQIVMGKPMAMSQLKKLSGDPEVVDKSLMMPEIFDLLQSRNFIPIQLTAVLRNSGNIQNIVRALLKSSACPELKKEVDDSKAISHTIDGPLPHLLDLTHLQGTVESLEVLTSTIIAEIRYYNEDCGLPWEEIAVLALSHADEMFIESILKLEGISCSTGTKDLGSVYVSTSHCVQSMEWPVVVLVITEMHYGRLQWPKWKPVSPEPLIHAATRAMLGFSLVLVDGQWNPLLDKIPSTFWLRRDYPKSKYQSAKKPWLLAHLYFHCVGLWYCHVQGPHHYAHQEQILNERQVARIRDFRQHVDHLYEFFRMILRSCKTQICEARSTPKGNSFMDFINERSTQFKRDLAISQSIFPKTWANPGLMFEDPHFSLAITLQVLYETLLRFCLPTKGSQAENVKKLLLKPFCGECAGALAIHSSQQCASCEELARKKFWVAAILGYLLPALRDSCELFRSYETHVGFQKHQEVSFPVFHSIFDDHVRQMMKLPFPGQELRKLAFGWT